MGDSRGLLAALLLGALACGGTGPPEREEGRVAVPPALAEGLGRAFREAGVPLRAVPLRPYERARDLEVLLLSSGSTAYDAYVIRATSLPLLQPWLAPVPAEGAGWREDVRQALRTEREGYVAGFPLSCDGPVLLLRQGAAPGWGEATGQYDLLELENALERGATVEGRPARLLTTLPPAVLFLSLAWSDEGGQGGAGLLPEGAANRAVAFLQRRFLGPPAPVEEAEEALLRGEAEGIFCWASEAEALLNRRQGRGPALGLRPMPHRGAFAQAPFGGWVLVWPLAGGGEGRCREVFRKQERLAEALARAGFCPPARPSSPAPSAAEATLLATRLRDLPFTAPQLEVLDQAVADAVEAGIAPEQALRRARARLAGERRTPP